MADVLKINRKLNIVMPPYMTEKGLVHIHSSPISLSTFKDHYRMLGRTFTQIQLEGYGPISGPSLASYILQDNAKAAGDTEHTEMLMHEIRRLTFVIHPAEKGWAHMPFVEAPKRGVITEEQAAEAENFLVYFTCASWIRLPNEAVAMMSLQTIWHAQIISSTVTEFMNSLPTSTVEGSTGENATQTPQNQRLSVPA